MAVARPVPFSARLSDAVHGRALALAGGFLGLCALGQLLALASFVGSGGVARARAAVLATAEASALPATAAPSGPTREQIAALAPAAPTPSIIGATTAAVAPTPPPALASVVPAVPTPVPAAAAPASADPAMAAANLPPPAFVQPTPAPVVLGRGSAGAGAVAEMVEQAKALRSRGDTQSALARLRDAQGLVGANESGPVIAEMALTFEQMGFADRALGQWQRLLELGEGAGAPYYLAESRLRGIGHVQPPVGGLVNESLTAAGGADPTGSGRDRAGFQENTLLRILEVKVEEDGSDPEAEKKLFLRTVIKSRSGSAIDARKVRVEAQFYDLVNGTEVVPTDAETGFQWRTSPVDWAGDASEILEATYRRLKGAEGAIPGTASALLPPPPTGPVPGRPGSAGVRRDSRGRRLPPAPFPPPPPAAPETVGAPQVYLGYMVRIYYNRQLQDVKADPAPLLKRFPAALTLPAEP